ncbi:MAG TPA: DUF72 domain-containing protein [Anaerolineales bacterium]
MNNHIGTSGWIYDHWQGVLYPVGMPPKDRLAVYVQHYQTVELNASYYHWPRDATFANWHTRLPPGFQMSVKAPRYLTRYSRLNEPEQWLARIRQGVEQLGDRFGVLLFQLSPDFPADLPRLSSFLDLLPANIPSAFEFRHPSWHQEPVFNLLEQHGVAYCVMSGAGLPCILRATAPFVYVRFHGPDPHSLYSGSYSQANLHWWADRIREWNDQGREVWAYFNNDGGGNAVRNADSLIGLLG